MATGLHCRRGEKEEFLLNSLMNLSKILGEEKTREEVMREIRSEPEVYSIFLDMQEPFQEQFIQFCMGVRGMK